MCVWDIEFLESEKIIDTAFGKTEHTPHAGECRAILPLSTCLIIVDSLISRRILSSIASLYKLPSHFILGGAKNTQCLDLAWTSQIVMQTGQDHKSESCIAAFDIARFYDNINAMHVVKEAIHKGFDISVMCAAFA